VDLTQYTSVSADPHTDNETLVGIKGETNSS